MANLETGMEDTGLQAMGASEEPSQLEEEEEGFEEGFDDENYLNIGRCGKLSVQDGQITWTLGVITDSLFTVQYVSSQEEQGADETLESEKCLKEKILGVVALASPVEGASTSEIMGLVGRAQFPASKPGHVIRFVSGLRWERKGSNGGIRYFLKEPEGYAERESAQLMVKGKGLLAVQMLQRMKLLFWEREWPSSVSAVILGLRFCGVELTDAPFILSAWQKLNTKGGQKKVSSLESLKRNLPKRLRGTTIGSSNSKNDAFCWTG